MPGTNIGSDGPIRVDRLDLDALTAIAADRSDPGAATRRAGRRQDRVVRRFSFSPDGRQLAYIHRHQWMLTGAPAGDMPLRS